MHHPMSAPDRASRRAVVAVACVLGLGAALAGSASAQSWVREYQKGIKSDSADQRRAAVEAIDTDHRAAFKLLLAVIANKNRAEVDWYQREVAVESLGKIEDPKALKDLDKYVKKLVKKSKEPDLLRSLLRAAARTGDERFHPYFTEVFEPKARHPVTVKRAAIGAMGYTEKLAFVDTILAAWAESPDDHRTGMMCRQALKEITQVDHGRELQRWQEFWKAEGEGYVKPSDRPAGSGADTGPEPDTEAREEKKRITTVTREMPPLGFTTTGREGADVLLVIHDDTWKPEYFDPYLSCVDDIYKIHYVELPTISQIVEHYKDQPDKIKKNIGGFPFYPYDALCDAFDEARQKQGHQKFALLAHGFSTMIAQRYLSKYAQNVDHAIMVGAFPSDDAYGDVLDKLRAKAKGMKEQEIAKAVDYHFITDEKTFTRFYDPKDDTELAALERKWFTMMFADPQDTEIGEIWERSKAPANLSLKVAEKEQSQSPPYDVMREKRPPVPLLVISGKKSMWFGEKEGERVAANYPRGKHVVLDNAANMPWFDDPAAFQKVVRDFHKEVTAAAGGRRK